MGATYATYWEELGIRLSDEDNKLRPFENVATRKAVEHDIDELIEMWREEATAMGQASCRAWSLPRTLIPRTCNSLPAQRVFYEVSFGFPVGIHRLTVVPTF